MKTRLALRLQALNGLASLIGTTACLVIAVELYEDLTEDRSHFRLPKIVKVIAMFGFMFWSVLEAHKALRRLYDLTT